MDKQYILKNYSFEKLSDEYDLSKFDCNSDDLNDFIKNDALKQQEENLSTTQLVLCDNEIIGFFSLLADTIKMNYIQDTITIETIKEQKPQVKHLPGVKIGRFAISNKYSNKGIGTHIMKQAIINILSLSKQVGLRFIIVDAYANAYNFYIKTNFTNLKKDEKTLKKIEKIKERDPERIFTMYQDIKSVKLQKELFFP